MPQDKVVSILRKLSPTVCGLLIMLSSSAQAQEEFWYQIEVLVFSQVSTQSYDSEKWPVNEQPLLPVNAKQLTLPSPLAAPVEPSTTGVPPLPDPFVELSEDKFDFQSTPTRLEKDNRYEILLHKAWAQPVYKGEQGTPVLLDDEHTENAYQEFSRNDDSYFEFDLNEDSTQESNPEELVAENIDQEMIQEVEMILPDDEIDPDWGLIRPDGEPLPEFNPRVRELTGPEELRVYGTVTLKMSRFLHLGIDMYFRTKRPELVVPEGLLAASFPMEGEANVSAEQEKQQDVKSEFLSSLEIEPIDFHLKESRRIKSKKIYYFDHPLFGVLADRKSVV